MATSFYFNSRRVKEPGVYTQVKSGIQNNPQQLAFGNVLIIDSGSMANYGGAGINGELTNGNDAIVGFDNIQSFRDFVRGGVWYDIAELLFRPASNNIPGASMVYLLHARTTTASTITLAFTDAAADDVTIKTKREGLGSVGAETAGNNLYKGYAATLESGVIDTAKFIVKFWEGTYRGTHSDSSDLDGISQDDALPRLIAQSNEVDTIVDLIAWMNNDADFQEYFSLTSPSATGDIIAGDLVALAGNNLAVGGTETYNATDVDDALDAVVELDYNILLSDKYNANAAGTENLKYQTHLETEAKYLKFLVVGGSDNATNFATQSLTPAATFNSAQVIVVHGGYKRRSPAADNALRTYTSLHKAALVVGRLAGLEPQTPLTFKSIAYDAEIHILSENERIQALDGGVLHTKYDVDLSSFIVNQGINTLQQNTNIVNADGASHLIQVMRISAQLMREIEFNAKLQLFGNQFAGPNRNRPSKEDVRQWLEGLLLRRTATDTVDNLILGFENIAVSVDQDAYRVNFEFFPNFEVNKMFFTGYLKDPNL